MGPPPPSASPASLRARGASLSLSLLQAAGGNVYHFLVETNSARPPRRSIFVFIYYGVVIHIGLVTVSLQFPLGWWAELQLTCSPRVIEKQSPN